jgi:predicted ester cyclase
MNKFCIILPLALILCFVVGCQDQAAMAELEAFRAQAEVEKQNEAIVRRTHDEVWSKGNVEIMDELYAPNYLAHWTGGGETHGLEEFKKIIVSGHAAAPDYTETIQQIVAKGDLVVTRFICEGTYTGDDEGIRATGKKIVEEEIAIHRIVDGKIVEQWTVG